MILFLLFACNIKNYEIASCIDWCGHHDGVREINALTKACTCNAHWETIVLTKQRTEAYRHQSDILLPGHTYMSCQMIDTNPENIPPYEYVK